MNRRAGGQTGINRELHMASFVIERRHDFATQQAHVQRVISAKPQVSMADGPVARDFAHIRQNAKLRMMEDERRAAIDHENMILLTKMRGIFSRGTQASNSGAPRPVEVEPRSLNQEKRRRELERITRENLGIVQRIRTRRPNYSAAEMARERRANEERVRRISRHGHRRSDYFTTSLASVSGLTATSSMYGSVGNLSRTSSAVRSGGARPRRLRALSPNQMSANLAASLTEELFREPSTDSGIYGTRAESAGGIQYGEQLLARSPPSPKLTLASTMSMDALRPVPMRQRGSPPVKASTPAGMVTRST